MHSERKKQPNPRGRWRYLEVDPLCLSIKIPQNGTVLRYIRRCGLATPSWRIHTIKSGTGWIQWMAGVSRHNTKSKPLKLSKMYVPTGTEYLEKWHSFRPFSCLKQVFINTDVEWRATLSSTPPTGVTCQWNANWPHRKILPRVSRADVNNMHTIFHVSI